MKTIDNVACSVHNLCLIIITFIKIKPDFLNICVCQKYFVLKDIYYKASFRYWYKNTL